jgi:mannose/cellobiose epimerase-like protein (N-acyl-D-glucosamine 2-epimerase family)
MLPEFASVSDAASAHDAFRRWMFDRALPFWAQAGMDAPGLGAREQLNLDGTPAAVGFKRTRVQGRQIYAFSHAALLGWGEGARAAEDCYRFITAHGLREDGVWVRRLSPDGREVTDGAIDLYDQAFMLFALAWYARLTGEREPLDRARTAAEWILAHMRRGERGFHNVLPDDGGWRQQNPHMHLLEAALALYETSRDGFYMELAGELVALFRGVFFDPATGALGEFFTPDWRIAPGADGDWIEPGHQFEWTWLLDQYGRLSGEGAGEELRALYRGGLAHGVDPETHVAVNRVGRDGRVQDAACRLWPQTEALKAHCVMLRRGEADEAAVAGVVRALGERFFDGCPPGAWMDQFDAQGRPAAKTIPTSSFYHIFMGYGELDRLVRPAA